MGLITDAWEREESRIESGIFFPDDTYIGMVIDDKNEQYLINSTRDSLDTLVEKNGSDWFQSIYIHPSATLYSDDYIIKAGGSSWEGAGHITLLRNKSNGKDNFEELIWIISFEERGPFSSVQVEGKNITARIKGEYGGEALVHIDINNPQEMAFSYK